MLETCIPRCLTESKHSTARKKNEKKEIPRDSAGASSRLECPSGQQKGKSEDDYNANSSFRIQCFTDILSSFRGSLGSALNIPRVGSIMKTAVKEPEETSQAMQAKAGYGGESAKIDAQRSVEESEDSKEDTHTTKKYELQMLLRNKATCAELKKLAAENHILIDQQLAKNVSNSRHYTSASPSIETNIGDDLPNLSGSENSSESLDVLLNAHAPPVLLYDDETRKKSSKSLHTVMFQTLHTKEAATMNSPKIEAKMMNDVRDSREGEICTGIAKEKLNSLLEEGNTQVFPPNTKDPIASYDKAEQDEESKETDSSYNGKTSDSEYVSSMKKEDVDEVESKEKPQLVAEAPYQPIGTLIPQNTRPAMPQVHAGLTSAKIPSCLTGSPFFHPAGRSPQLKSPKNPVMIPYGKHTPFNQGSLAFNEDGIFKQQKVKMNQFSPPPNLYHPWGTSTRGSATNNSHEMMFQKNHPNIHPSSGGQEAGLLGQLLPQHGGTNQLQARMGNNAANLGGINPFVCAPPPSHPYILPPQTNAGMNGGPSEVNNPRERAAGEGGMAYQYPGACGPSVQHPFVAQYAKQLRETHKDSPNPSISSLVQAGSPVRCANNRGMPPSSSWENRKWEEYPRNHQSSSKSKSTKMNRTQGFFNGKDSASDTEGCKPSSEGRFDSVNTHLDSREIASNHFNGSYYHNGRVRYTQQRGLEASLGLQGRERKPCTPPSGFGCKPLRQFEDAEDANNEASWSEKRSNWQGRAANDADNAKKVAYHHEDEGLMQQKRVNVGGGARCPTSSSTSSHYKTLPNQPSSGQNAPYHMQSANRMMHPYRTYPLPLDEGGDFAFGEQETELNAGIVSQSNEGGCYKTSPVASQKVASAYPFATKSPIDLALARMPEGHPPFFNKSLASKQAESLSRDFFLCNSLAREGGGCNAPCGQLPQGMDMEDTSVAKASSNPKSRLFNSLLNCKPAEENSGGPPFEGNTWRMRQRLSLGGEGMRNSYGVVDQGYENPRLPAVYEDDEVGGNHNTFPERRMLNGGASILRSEMMYKQPHGDNLSHSHYVPHRFQGLMNGSDSQEGGAAPFPRRGLLEKSMATHKAWAQTTTSSSGLPYNKDASARSLSDSPNSSSTHANGYLKKGIHTTNDNSGVTPATPSSTKWVPQEKYMVVNNRLQQTEQKKIKLCNILDRKDEKIRDLEGEVASLKLRLRKQGTAAARAASGLRPGIRGGEAKKSPPPAASLRSSSASSSENQLQARKELAHSGASSGSRSLSRDCLMSREDRFYKASTHNPPSPKDDDFMGDYATDGRYPSPTHQRYDTWKTSSGGLYQANDAHDRQPKAAQRHHWLAAKESERRPPSSSHAMLDPALRRNHTQCPPTGMVDCTPEDRKSDGSAASSAPNGASASDLKGFQNNQPSFLQSNEHFMREEGLGRNSCNSPEKAAGPPRLELKCDDNTQGAETKEFAQQMKGHRLNAAPRIHGSADFHTPHRARVENEYVHSTRKATQLRMPHVPLPRQVGDTEILAHKQAALKLAFQY